MGIVNSTIATAPTISVSGGTSSTLTDDGASVSNGVHLIDASVSDFRVRPSVTFKTKQPTYDSKTDSWSKGRKSIQLVIPKLTAVGPTVFPLGRIELEDHPEMSDAEVTKILDWLAQLCALTAFRTFLKTGSLS